MGFRDGLRPNKDRNTAKSSKFAKNLNTAKSSKFAKNLNTAKMSIIYHPVTTSLRVFYALNKTANIKFISSILLVCPKTTDHLEL